MAINHQNNFATNLTSNQIAGVTTTPLDSIPSIDANFYLALDATNVNGKYEVVECTGKTATNVNHAATTYAHTTAEEVRMVIPAAEMDAVHAAVSDGWHADTGGFTYASASTITVIDGTIYQKGDKLKFTQPTDGVKYMYVKSISTNTLTVTGGDDYDLDNEAITSPYYSRYSNPKGFPKVFAFTSTIVGFTTGTDTFDFRIDGGICTIFFDTAFGGTSNATNFTFTVPVANENICSGAAFVAAQDNNALLTTPASIELPSAGTTTFNAHKLFFNTAWTNTNAKNIWGRLSYEID